MMIAFVATIIDSIGVFSFTLAYQLDSSGFISLIGYMRIIYAYLVDVLYFHTSVQMVSIVAAVVILVVAITVSILKMVPQRR